MGFLFSVATLFAVGKKVAAQIPFAIEKANPIKEPWRWHELEALRDLYLSGGTEDEEGKLWFGYPDGILSYDGRTIEKFAFPEAIGQVRTHCIFANQMDDLVVFTSMGLLRFQSGEWKALLEYNSDYFNPRKLVAKNSQGLTVVATPSGLYQLLEYGVEQVAGISRWVLDVEFDKYDNLWLAVDDSANVLMIPNTGRAFSKTPNIRHYRFTEVGGLSPQIVYNSYEDQLLFHSWRPDIPAFVYSRDSDRFSIEPLSEGIFFASHPGSVSVGKHGFLFHTKSGVFNRYKGQWSEVLPSRENLPVNGTYSFRRRNGNLIIGGQGESIYEIDLTSQRWKSYPGLNFQCEADDGHLWFLTLAGGIVEYDPDLDAAVLHNSGVIESPQVMLCSKDGAVWAAGAHAGVAAVSYYDGRSWRRDRHPELGHYISYLSAINLDSGGIAFGTGSEYSYQKGGLVIYHPTTSGYDYSYALFPLVPNRIVGMAQTDPEHLWLGGFKLINIELPGFAPKRAPEDLEVLWVDHISADNDGGLWVATWERGLFHLADGRWKQFGPENGLISEQVFFVLNDLHRPGTIWIATHMGLSRFENGSWINEILPSGFQFNREGGTLKQSSDGALWLNFARRDWYYRRENSSFALSSLKDVFKSVCYKPGSEPPVVQFLDYYPEVVAPANIHISWNGLDFWSVTPEDKLEYSYRLDSGDWSPFSRDDSVVLTGLSKGPHSLELKVRDLDGNVGFVEKAAIFSVVPPLWQRGWFLLFVLFILIVIIAQVVLLVRQRVHSILRLEEFKLQFFTNLSHELRTPISLILGPLRQYLSKLPGDADPAPLKLALTNAQRLNHLVDQILEYRRFEVSNIKLNHSHADLVQVIQESIRQAEPLSLEKNQKVYFMSRLDRFLAWFDPDTVEKILGNLVLNAIKYTETGGEIMVKLSIDHSDSDETVIATISVEDNGIGIPDNEVVRIFEPFYQVRESAGLKSRGSGLGLALTKILVERCGGRIKVKSPITIGDDNKAKGTRFVVTLPLSARPPSTAMPEARTRTIPPELEQGGELVLPQVAGSPEADITVEKPKILLAEDDADMRAYLKSELENTYQILEATDGNSGWKVAVKEVPDLIISDVMMPGMDGNEFCRRIKNNEITSHIPFFMLTALKAPDHELKSLDRGADDFFTKPVNFPILKQRIRNLFEYRSRLHDRYNQLHTQTTLDARAITSNALDESFLNRALRLIEENLPDSLFGVETFARRMHMSRMTLYRKFKALTGETPSHCLRRLRMQRASELLLSGTYNVSEVSDRVGMKDVAYFCTMFKKQFGVTPGEFGAKSKEPSPASRLSFK